MPVRTSNFLSLVIVAPAACIFCLGGCDSSSFEPFTENRAKPFSIYGYLDTSADTQWVRVMPVRQSYLLGPEEIDATVTLEHPASGETAVMKGVLTRYREAYAWNFRSTMEIRPDTRYRVIAERSDGIVSNATVTIPGDFPPPVLRVDPLRMGPDLLKVEGIGGMALVDEVYHLRNRDTGREWVVHESVKRYFTIPSNSYEWLEFSRNSPASFGVNVEIVEFYIFVGALSEDWPETAGLDEEGTTIPGEASNVENGFGYVGGVVGKKVPYKSCRNENGQYIACPEKKKD